MRGKWNSSEKEEPTLTSMNAVIIYRISEELKNIFQRKQKLFAKYLSIFVLVKSPDIL